MSSELVTIVTFSDRFEADQAYERLKSAGIESLISGDDAGGWFPYFAQATGGFALRVYKDDAEEAKRILQE